MATYSVYDNILMKLESIYLKVEMEVDHEITNLALQDSALKLQLKDLKNKVEVLNSVKRSFELYCDNQQELNELNHSLFKVLCDKQILLRFLQEKEILLNGYTISLPEIKLPTVIEINKELRLRKQLEEIALLSSFLMEDQRFEHFYPELEKMNAIFDLSTESGATDKLEAVVILFHHYFDKVVHLYDIDKELVVSFKSFREQILEQANHLLPFKPENVSSLSALQKVYKSIRNQRLNLENDVESLFYQFTMLHNGKKYILLETKAAVGELESLIFKEYAARQKIQELKQYKLELNSQKQCFMRDPTVDGYTEAVRQLELIENRFKRLTLYKNYDKQKLINRFFAANQPKVEKSFAPNEQTPYNKLLFQVLHNNHISSEDKMIILRLSKASKLINTSTGKFFYQRTAKTRSLQTIENSFKKCHNHELH